MKLTINDPRQYSSVYPDSNILLNQSRYDLENNCDNSLLTELLRDVLANDNDQLLSVAYNLAPSQEISDYLWNSLQQILACSLVEVLVYPVVLIVGSETQVELPGEINQDELQQLLMAKGMLGLGDFVSGKLFTVEGVSRIKPSLLYRWNNDFATVKQWSEAIDKLPNSAVINLGEGVHLRFLVALRHNETFATKANDISAIGMDLLKLLNNGLKSDGVTLFPLPFSPCRLGEGAARGEFHRQEIAITLALSNLVKKLRQHGKTPYVKVSSQKNNLQLELWCEGETKPVEILLWRVQRSDDFDQICEILGALLLDMQLNVEYYPEYRHEH